MASPKDSADQGKLAAIETQLHTIENKINRYNEKSPSSEKSDLTLIQKCLDILSATMKSLTQNASKAVMFQDMSWLLISSSKSEQSRDFIREIKTPVLETILMIYRQLKKDLQPLQASPEKAELQQRVEQVIANIQAKHDLNNSLSLSHYQKLSQDISMLMQYQPKIEQVLSVYQRLQSSLDAVPFQQRNELSYRINTTIKAVQTKPYEQDYSKIHNEQLTIEKQIQSAGANNKPGSLSKMFSKAPTSSSSVPHTPKTPSNK